MKKFNSVLMVILICAVTVFMAGCGDVSKTENSSQDNEKATQNNEKATQNNDKATESNEKATQNDEKTTETATNIATKNQYLEVEAPAPNDKITSPVLVKGKSNFFEANTRIRIKDEKGEVLADTSTLAEGWTDKLYPFSKEVTYKTPTTQIGFVEVFESSPKDGSEIHKITIPVIFGQKTPMK